MNETYSDHPRDWVPNGCPPDVVASIEADQVLERYKLRDLASADTAAVRGACRRLERLLAGIHDTALNRGRWQGALVGIAVGMLASAGVLLSSFGG